MSGGKSGSSTTTQESSIPAYIEHYAKQNLHRAAQVAQLGYQPYYGPDVAALTPFQLAAMDNNRAAAGAFGMTAPAVNTLMDAPTEYAGGVRGYSSGPIFDAALSEYIARHPEQAARYDALFGNAVAPYVAPVAAAPPQAVVNPGAGQDNYTDTSGHTTMVFGGPMNAIDVLDPANTAGATDGGWGSHSADGWSEYAGEFK